MTGFRKTVSILCTKSPRVHFNFTTPKGLKITPSDDKKREREQQEKEDERMEEKKGLTFLLGFTLTTLENWTRFL